MTSFVCAENEHGEKLIINVGKIAWFHIPSCTVCFSAISGENNGLLHLSEKGLKEILDGMYIRGLSDE